MGHEARYQAIPEESELVKCARYDRYIAEMLQSFDYAAHETWYFNYGPPTEPEWFFYTSVWSLVRERPALIDRHHDGTQGYDMIMYLLSSARRQNSFEDDDSLIHKVIYGSELLHPEATATQGRPIGFVPAAEVHHLTDYLTRITFDQLHEHYDPQAMSNAGVYKFHATNGEDYFHGIWHTFRAVTKVYQAASDYDEAIIAVID